VIAAEFNARHPERENISHIAVFKFLKKFNGTGSVHDKDRPGRPRTATAEDMATAVEATLVKGPKRSSRRVASLTGISQRSVLRVVHENKWHPYKLQLQHRLTEDDPDRRVQWASERRHDDPMFPQRVLFSDEALFFVHGEVKAKVKVKQSYCRP
jgi:transposase